tara:strand:+ start:258 stop:830 length:573 start_codon:yes stop_codon:yes gene_type:complete
MAIPYNPNKAKENENTEFKPIDDGTYFAHVFEVQEGREVQTKTDKLCDIYKVTLKIDGDKHPEYKERRIWADVWITKKVKVSEGGAIPPEKDNYKFHKFLESIDYPIDKKIVEENGSKVETLLIPGGNEEMDNDAVVGKPVLVKTKSGKWINDNGETMVSVDVSQWHPWIDGAVTAPAVNIADEDDDLPF